MSEQRSPYIRFQRSVRSLVPSFVFTAVVAFVGFVMTMNVPGSSLELPFETESAIVTVRLPIFLLLVLFLLARPLVMLVDTHFEISDNHLRIVRGKLSWWSGRQEFAFEDLLGVQVTQSVIERILGVGSIKVGSKTHNIEVVMRGVANPQHFANLISRRIDASRIKQRSRA